MRLILARAKGLLLEPRATWRAIAAEGDSTRFLRTRYLPLLVVTPWLLVTLAQWLLAPLEPETHAVFQRAPDGTLAQIGTGTRTQLVAGAFTLLLLPLGVAVTAGGVWLMRRLILSSAERHGAAPDAVAALKLAAYAPTPAWLAAWLMPVPVLGFLLVLLGSLYTVWHFRHAAPLLLPTMEAETDRFGRTIAMRAVLVGLGMAIALFVALVLLALVFRPTL